MSDEIGYRKPPKNSQFKKGTSGNPKGRPKGSKNLMTILDEELERKVTVNENGKKTKISRGHAMIKRMVSVAMQGDLKSTLALLEFKRRTGSFDRAEVTESLLPDNYQSVLDAYIQKRRPKT